MRIAALFFSGLLLGTIPVVAQNDTNTAPVHAYGPVIMPVPSAPSTVAPTDAAPGEGSPAPAVRPEVPPARTDTTQVAAPAAGPVVTQPVPTNAGQKQDEIYDIRPP